MKNVCLISVPGKPPLNVIGRAISSQSILVNWTQVPYEYTHGKVTGYTIRYREEEGTPSKWQNHRANQLFAIVSELEENFNYNIQVGGMTRKGSGAWSESILVKTKQDGKAGAYFLYVYVNKKRKATVGVCHKRLFS